MANPHKDYWRNPLNEFGPQHPFCDQIHAEKYRGPGEGFPEAMNRVASACSDNPEHYKEFREVIRDMRFMPAGRIQAAMGSSKGVTPYNCYVSGTIEDSFIEGHGSIMGRATEAAQTMRMGGGIGYDFSSLRPRGADIRKLGSKSSGPVSFMEIFDSVCRCVASSGHRRGAQMGVLRIDHPDIEEFIHAKQNVARLTGFNVSVAVTDQFMECLSTGAAFPLVFDGRVHREVDAAVIWEMLMRSTWDWAEPGVLFIDRINELNNLWYCETIAATNPCGEQPLPPYGACLLGSFNLVKYLLKINHDPARWSFDWHQFHDDIPHVVRAMDNVIDRAKYPLFEQQQEAQSKRRMGLGITALANAAEALGYPYGSPAFLEFESRVLESLRDESYRASAQLAKEKGPFKLYDAERYMKGKFVATLHPDVLDDVRRYGIRNSHLTSIAPTGTISLAADNVSSGIEPVFSYVQRRLVNMPEGQVETELQDYGVAHLGVQGKRAQDVSIHEHLSVLTVAANLVDSAVSKTLNVPASTPWEAFKQIYVTAWERGVKGCTTFTDGGKREGILVSADEPEACKWDPETGVRSCE
jgi:ribonucleoside-diphosphate reductase alpha chain